ncbi:MAG TPA: SRPBCC family protein [Dongiaceae bacterium]
MTEMKTIRIAPVRKSIRVKASQAHAFDVFTSRIGRWWPIEKAKVSPGPIKDTTIEPKLGGRWFETGMDGTETTVGHILVWEPPQRFVVTWEVNCHWKSDATTASQVEVRFIADGPDTTLVELEHGQFERMAEGGESIRKDVDRGWPGMLELFKIAAEARAGDRRDP